MLETIRQDYIRTARAKGQTEFKIIMHHALKNAFVPILTVIGMQFGANLGGTVITETVFAIPGIGMYTIDSIKSRDQWVVMGSVMFLSFCVCVINLIVDILYSFIDPRVKSLYASPRRRNRHRRKEARQQYENSQIYRRSAAAKVKLGEVFQRFCRNKLAVTGAIIMILLVAVAIFAPLLAPYPYDLQDAAVAKQGPSLAHLFGTDNYGRDIFSRCIYGAQNFSFGGHFGGRCGHYRRWPPGRCCCILWRDCR